MAYEEEENYSIKTVKEWVHMLELADKDIKQFCWLYSMFKELTQGTDEDTSIEDCKTEVEKLH